MWRHCRREFPYVEQQFHAVMAENGVLNMTSAEQETVATAIRREL